MLTDKYGKILKQFELHYPELYSQAENWWASGRMSITVKLQDGSMFEYDWLDNSIRHVRTKNGSHDDEVLRKEFSANLEKMIPYSGLTKSELAKKLGITNAMLSRYLRGTSMPSVDKAYKIARAIGCRVDELFDDTYME